MNTVFWENIRNYNFDDPLSEYGFSTRLASENAWTSNFTSDAILEYRKFMYLAAVAEGMVSPPEIVDIVWHQHLIFTASYNDFCVLLGKRIEHVPSTHNKQEAIKFQQAKNRTSQLYLDAFGQAPKNIWDYNSIYEPLGLPKSPVKLRGLLIIAILTVLLLHIPIYLLVRPWISSINNPDFMIGYSIAIVLIGFATKFYNDYYLLKMLRSFPPESFIYKLSGSELIYLEKASMGNVVNSTINELLGRNVLNVRKDGKIDLVTNEPALTPEELVITEAITTNGSMHYMMLIRTVAYKPVFNTVANSMDALKKYFAKSRRFATLFLLNFSVFALLFVIGICRLYAGLSRDKPVDQISFAVLAMGVAMTILLIRLANNAGTNFIPYLYKKNIIDTGDSQVSWDWKYFAGGTMVMSAAFLPLILSAERSAGTTFGSDSSSSSCGSSCGSSCSSCGGCGGD